MDQSPSTPPRVVDEKRQADPSTGYAQEQHVSFHNPPPHQREPAPFSSKAAEGDYQVEDEQEEEIDEEEEQRAFEQRLLAAQRNHGEQSSAVSDSSPPQQQQQHPLPGSPPDSMDSNDFVKLEKPRDLFNAPAHPVVEVHLETRDEEITPSDDVAPPVGEDLSDFASSPQDAAHDLADRAHQTLEQFLASSGEASGRSGRDEASFMHHGDETATSTHRVAFDDDDEETFRRHGPLTLGQPAVEAKPLHRDTDRGLNDDAEPPTLVEQVRSTAEDAAAAVGEFASKITHDAQEGALRAKEVMEHAAYQAKEAVSYGATKGKEAVEDLLDFEETTEGDTAEGAPHSFGMKQPEMPIILPPVRPPTPPKPRAADAPATPPILDLGGPGHPHVYPPSYQRKPSLKITSGMLGATGTGAPLGAVGGGSGLSWFDLRRWDKNVLDLIYWRDVKKSGIVFGITLALLICLAVFNIITVVSYLSLIVLGAALGYRAYSGVLATVQKSEHKNPFHPYLERSLELPQGRVHEQVDVFLKHTKDLLHQLRRLFFVEDICDTLKFALLLWALTYVGAYLSGMALTILALVGLFTLPKVYELYQPQIDNYYGIVESKVKQASDIAREQLDKVPFFKKQKPEEKKE